VLNSGQAALLWVHGPGGVGKSTLLQRLAQLASDKGMPVLFPDARDLPPTQEGVVKACAKRSNPRSPPPRMASSGG
jgi:ABC-type cobalamin transport system ATPase subunit